MEGGGGEGPSGEEGSSIAGGRTRERGEGEEGRDLQGRRGQLAPL